jgi:hypothetical protein
MAEGEFVGGRALYDMAAARLLDAALAAADGSSEDPSEKAFPSWIVEGM